MGALDEQIAGNHYKDMAIQPVEFIYKNKIGFLEGNIIKYVCRYSKKNGKEDIKKARHYCDLLIQMIEEAEKVDIGHPVLNEFADSEACKDLGKK